MGDEVLGLGQDLENIKLKRKLAEPILKTPTISKSEDGLTTPTATGFPTMDLNKDKQVTSSQGQSQFEGKLDAPPAIPPRHRTNSFGNGLPPPIPSRSSKKLPPKALNLSDTTP